MMNIFKNKYLAIVTILVVSDIFISILLPFFKRNINLPGSINTFTPPQSQEFSHSPQELKTIYNNAQTSQTGTQVDTLYPNVSISFPEPLSSEEQKKVNLQISPNINAKLGWSSTNDSAFLAFFEKLSPNQTYTVTATTPNKTYSWTFTTPSTGGPAQPSMDDAYANTQRLIQATYPWYDSFPIRGDHYFVYFDTDQKKFFANIYPLKNLSGSSVDQQTSTLKKTVTDKLLEVSSDTQKYQVVWNITPVSE